jgi:choice-of-anchor A domain-containing protein
MRATLSLVVGVLLLAIGVSAPAGAMAADCADNPLGDLDEWNIVVRGDLQQSNTDSEGRVAAGRDVVLSNYGVASALPTDGSRVDLVAGRDLTGTNVGVNHGSVTYGRALYGNVTAPNGSVTHAAPPFDFTTVFAAAEARSASWAALPANGAITGPAFGALTLRGDDPVRNVFAIAATALQGAQRILIRVPFGSTTLINVTGAGYSTAVYPTASIEFWDGSAFRQFGDQAPSPELEAMRRAMLWNFPDATNVQIGPGLAWQGSVLAPLADIRFEGSTQLNGTIIGNALHGDGESHLHPPTGLCLPEPSPCPPVTPVDPVEPLEPTPPSEPTLVTPGQPLAPGESPGPVAGTSAEEAQVGACKKVITRNGRAVTVVHARAGDHLRFRLRGTNLGFELLRDVRVCDAVPAGLVLLHATDQATLSNGRLCWHVETLDTQRQGFATMLVTRRTDGTITNTITVTSTNGGTDRNAARVRVRAARTEPSKVTG